MKNDKQQPSFREIDNHLQNCMDRGVKAFLDGLTKYDNDFEPGSLDFDAWASGFSIAQNGFKAPLSNETKVVHDCDRWRNDECVCGPECYDITHSETKVVESVPINCLHSFCTECGAAIDVIPCEGTVINIAKECSKQFKNTDAVKVITDRIEKLENNLAFRTHGWLGNKLKYQLQEAKDILKLIQSC